jgi:hypothetical protein
VAGVDTYRGIAYQHAQAILLALDLLEHPVATMLRVEGVDDVIDVELLDDAGRIVMGRQMKVREDTRTWGQAELLGVLRRWAELDVTDDATFAFVTDGRLGPTGEAVRDALGAAAEGRCHELATLLDEPVGSTAVRRLRRATVVQDVATTGHLLARAEQQAAALLPQERGEQDTLEQARHAVDGLYRLLMERACQPDPQARLIHRDEICDALGIPRDNGPLRPWPGELRAAYLATVSAQGPTDRVPATARRRDGGPAAHEPEPLAAALLAGAAAASVSGATGAGKSTAARELRFTAARQDQVVLLAHAETYLAGRLDALAADALGDVLGTDIPMATGRQALADPATVLVIDGVSEVPREVQAALANDLRAPVGSRRWARVVLLGREAAVLRSVLPSAAAPVGFDVEPFDRDRRQAVVARVVRESGEPQGDDVPARRLLAQVEAALGDAAGNPMLLEMGVQLLLAGRSFHDRAGLYTEFVDQLAARSGATGMDIAAVVLGVTFAGLLDDGRRYADRYTWLKRLGDATRDVSADIGPTDPTAVDAAARRAGLVTPLGLTGTVVPVHDSFADYLAGRAHAQGAVPLPQHIHLSDEHRLLFAAALGGVDAELATRVMRDMPLLAPKLAGFDRRSLNDSSPLEVEKLLAAVMPHSTVVLWRADATRVVAMLGMPGPSRWLDNSEGAAAIRTRAWLSVEGGPLDVAVRLWRRHLLGLLPVEGRAGPGRTLAGDEAAHLLTEYTEQVATEVTRLVRLVLPQSQQHVVLADMDPPGMHARLRLAHQPVTGRPEWSVSYRSAEDIVIDVVGNDDDCPDPEFSGRATFDSFLDKPPTSRAAARLRKAIGRVAGERWLQG